MKAITELFQVQSIRWPGNLIEHSDISQATCAPNRLGYPYVYLRPWESLGAEITVCSGQRTARRHGASEQGEQTLYCLYDSNLTLCQGAQAHRWAWSRPPAGSCTAQQPRGWRAPHCRTRAPPPPRCQTCPATCGWYAESRQAGGTIFKRKMSLLTKEPVNLLSKPMHGTVRRHAKASSRAWAVLFTLCKQSRGTNVDCLLSNTSRHNTIPHTPGEVY